MCVNGLPLNLRPQGFFQTNTPIAAELYQRLSLVLYDAADYRQAEEALDTALGLCRTGEDAGTEVACVTCLVYVLRERGEWKKVSWEVALETVANGLKTAGSELATLVSPSSTVEELCLLSRLTRALGSKNIDHRLRQADFRDQEADPAAPGLGGLAISEIDVPEPYEPQDITAKASLAGLTTAVIAYGVLEPIRVRLAAGRYVLVDGAKRLRACEDAGVVQVPAQIEAD